jgi:hypothetical protein
MKRRVSEPYTGLFIDVYIDEYTAHVYDWYIAKRKEANEKYPRPYVEPNLKGCYNGISNWYEKGFVSPWEARYPSFEENPAAYISGGD